MTSLALLVLDRDGLGRDGFGHDGFGQDGLGRNGFGSAMGSAATELNNQPFGTGTENRKQVGGDTGWEWATMDSAATGLAVMGSAPRRVRPRWVWPRRVQPRQMQQ